MTTIYTKARNGRSVLPQECIDEILEIIDSLYNVPGCMVECGSFKCGTAMEMAMRDDARLVYALDAFGGKKAMEAFVDSSLAEVLEYTKNQKNLTVMQGDICDLVNVMKAPVALLLLDCDEYEPTLAALKTISPLMPVGAKIIGDDMAFNDIVKAFAAWDSYGWTDKTLGSGMVVYTREK